MEASLREFTIWLEAEMAAVSLEVDLNVRLEEEGSAFQPFIGVHPSKRTEVMERVREFLDCRFDPTAITETATIEELYHLYSDARDERVDS